METFAFYPTPEEEHFFEVKRRETSIYCLEGRTWKARLAVVYNRIDENDGYSRITKDIQTQTGKTYLVRSYNVCYRDKYLIGSSAYECTCQKSQSFNGSFRFHQPLRFFDPSPEEIRDLIDLAQRILF